MSSIPDEKKEYRQALDRHCPCAFLEQEERLVHKTVSSRESRTKDNPLAAVNYLDREFRKDLHEHTREALRDLDKMTWFRKRVTPLKTGAEYLQKRAAA